MPSKIFQEILNSVPQKVQRSIGRSMKIAAKIDEILKEKGLKQSDLAKIMNKKESEISKWLSGDHNFTIDTIDKIENALDAEIFSITLKSTNLEAEKLNQTIKFSTSFEGKIFPKRNAIVVTETITTLSPSNPIQGAISLEFNEGYEELPYFTIDGSRSSHIFKNQWRQEEFNKNNPTLSRKVAAKFTGKTENIAS